MKRIKIIGLTGQSGSGKSTVSEYFKKRNITVINADKLVREIYNANSPCVKTIAATFGDDVLDKNGEIIRPILAQKAFSSKEATIKLNTVVHPFVTYEFLKQVNRALKNGEKYVLYDAPQLFESNADLICDVIISVIADKEVRLKRICARDNIDYNSAELRINAQFDEEFFRQNSDFIIDNNSDIEFLEKQAQRCFNIICN